MIIFVYANVCITFKRLCIRIGHYGAIQMLYYYYYYYYVYCNLTALYSG